VEATNIVCQVDKFICVLTKRKKEDWGCSKVWLHFTFYNSLAHDYEVLCLLGWAPVLPSAVYGKISRVACFSEFLIEWAFTELLSRDAFSCGNAKLLHSKTNILQQIVGHELQIKKGISAFVLLVYLLLPCVTGLYFREKYELHYPIREKCGLYYSLNSGILVNFNVIIML